MNKNDVNLNYFLVTKLYLIGMIGAVMELEGSNRLENGVTYETKIGEYKLTSYFGNLTREDTDSMFAETNDVSITLSKNGEDYGPVYCYKKLLKSEKYAQMLANSGDEENYKLREEFIVEMLLGSKSEGICIMPSDKEYGLLDEDKKDLIVQILDKAEEILNEYMSKKSQMKR